MLTKESLLKDLDWVTEKISTQVWVLNLGTLGTTWSLLITNSVVENYKITAQDSRWIFVFCIGALLCEMGQYLSAYVMYRLILSKLEKSGGKKFEFDQRSSAYRCRMGFFYAKIALTVCGSLILLMKVFSQLG